MTSFLVIFDEKKEKNLVESSKYDIIIKTSYYGKVYDLFHIGHLNLLKNAKGMCDKLVVGVTTDELCYSRKNKFPIINYNDRVEIVKSIKYVDSIIEQSNMNKIENVKKIKANVVFVGSDWRWTDSWMKYEEEFKINGVDVIYLEHTDGISSTILREKVNNGN